VNTAVELQLRSIELFERPVTLRLPFRFGAATVTHCPQAFVRVQATVDGRSVEGATAELMVPKWFDKNPALTHEQNFEQLRLALRLARDAYGGAGAALTPWAHADRCGNATIERGVALGLPRLAAQFGAALLDKAVADAALRSAAAPWARGVQAGLLGDPWHAALSLLAPGTVLLRHTVGLADRLHEGEPGPDPQDGLPATLQAAIAACGLTHFKLKLCGDIERDAARLAAIASLLQAQVPEYRVTLDGNETFADAEALGRWWQHIAALPALQPLLAHTLLLEQPIARAGALETPIGALGIPVPVILDESDDHPDAFERGLALGYRGISSKACKGIYRSLHSAARVAREPQRLLLSGEDLTCQAGLAVQQDTLLAASLGVTHIERNGHHYVDGFGVAPQAEAQAFATAHAGFYGTGGAGAVQRPRLRVHQGRLDLRSLHVPGFGSAVHPSWAELQPLR
jgi:hypothetical protein